MLFVSDVFQILSLRKLSILLLILNLISIQLVTFNTNLGHLGILGICLLVLFCFKIGSYSVAHASYSSFSCLGLPTA